jgi:hypothetical protein
MGELNSLAKTLMLIGGLIFLFGLIITFIDKVPFIGRLPGDIYVKRKNFTFYFPLATGILLSIVLTIILNLFRK